MQFRYSAIDSFIQCPQKWYKTYVLGEREDIKSSAMEFGTAIHMALNSHFEGEDPYAMFNTYWDATDKLKLEYDRHSWEDLRSLANNKFIPNFLRLHAKKFTNVKLEQTLEMPFIKKYKPTVHETGLIESLEDGYHTLQGTFDLAGMYDDKLTLLDFKTSAREYPQSKIYRNPQMYIYAALYEKEYGVLPDQLMYKVFIKTEGRIQTLKIPLTKEKLNTIMSNVEAICKNMLRMVEEKSIYSNYNCYCGKDCFK